MRNPETFRSWLTETLDTEQIEGLADHGADAGWPGLTYTSDCVELFERFQDEIREALNGPYAYTKGDPKYKKFASRFRRDAVPYLR